MNIFVLHTDPKLAAPDHCDKHVVKMVIEYGQMLSTAKRMVDGRYATWTVKNPETGKVKRIAEYLLPDEGPAEPVWVPPQFVNDPERYTPGKFKLVIENQQCYRVAHANHPCSMWAREMSANYEWLFALFEATLEEHTKRYGKVHAADRLRDPLRLVPLRMKRGGLTTFVQAMPEEYKHESAVAAYRQFYAGSKSRFAKWRFTPVPQWYTDLVEGKDVPNLY